MGERMDWRKGGQGKREFSREGWRLGRNQAGSVDNTYCAVQEMKPNLFLPQLAPSSPRLFRSKHMSNPTLVPEERRYS